MEKFDIAVIGSGPGGYVAAIRSAQLGYKTLLIEKYETLGGTCTNVGCIPTKALLDSTHKYEDAQTKFAEAGIATDSIKLDFRQMMKRKSDVVRKNTQGIEFLMQKNNITKMHGTARFINNEELCVEDLNGVSVKVVAEKYIIATGSKPSGLPGIHIDKKRILSSTEALNLDHKPESIIIIGGGVIGVEMASIFNRIGTKVTVLEYADHLISGMDHGLGKGLKKILSKRGIDVRLNQSVYEAADTGEAVIVKSRDKNGKEIEITSEYVLVAVGRVPYTQGLGLESTSVQCDEKGFIITNRQLQTHAPNIYAIGDVKGGPLLAHKAEEEGIFVAETLNGQKPAIHYGRIPSVVYSWPEVASVGASEEELKKKNRAYSAGSFPFSASAMARASGDTEGFVKVLVDPRYGEVLGIHIIGPRAADLIAQGVVAMEYEVTAKDMFSISYAHPSYSEVLKEAYMQAYGQPPINI